ncbi:hypothetical protein [Microbacterium esteraromaticum]|uniref:hypothetical protein n=1 Tax=Microbacterium esteraromaticum TaxID=57043 RepID=UPI00195658E0|nr:hypothetical protein [Microbacterium esteraromaticum]MBM7465341.1 hypothetical protein [Microbacterium esteraromaticum]
MSARRRRRPSRRRTRRRGLEVAAVTVGAAILASGVLAVLALITAPRPEGYCLDQPEAYPAFGISGWRGEQLENAAIIVRTARELGFARDGQIIGVMAAMGESSLRNIDHGDWETSGVTNPDGSRTTSIGLFQQQEWWGSTAERMDPAIASSMFFTRLSRVPDWRSLEPSHAINRVQINSDREHYARFADDAADVVDALSGPCPTPSASRPGAGGAH